MAERRQEGVRMLQSGKMPQAQIARELGVSEAAVSQWKKKLDQGGPKVLQPRQASGRPAKLKEADQQTLVKKTGTRRAGGRFSHRTVDASPSETGDQTGIWGGISSEVHQPLTA